MTLQQMIALFRTEAFDNSNPPLFADTEIITWLNEAQVEAAIRMKLLRENTNPLFCKYDIRESVMDYPVDSRMFQIEYASLIFQGANGMLPYVLAVTSAEELDGVRPFWRTLPFRPTGIIVYDTSFRTDALPNSNFTISVEGYRLPNATMDQQPVPEVLATSTITLTGGAAGSVDSIQVNGIEALGVSMPYDVSLTQTATDIAAQINTWQNRFVASALGAVITLTDLPTSGSAHNGWTVAVTSTTITTTATALAGGVDAVVTSPEINQIHHRFLVKWAMHRGYERPDAESYDPDKATRALKEFEDYFGIRPDASLRKRYNASKPHRNLAYG